LTATFPHAGQRLSQFFVRDVQVPLRRLDVGVSEHQLDDPEATPQPDPATPFIFLQRPLPYKRRSRGSSRMPRTVCDRIDVREIANKLEIHAG